MARDLDHRAAGTAANRPHRGALGRGGVAPPIALVVHLAPAAKMSRTLNRDLRFRRARERKEACAASSAARPGNSDSLVSREKPPHSRSARSTNPGARASARNAGAVTTVTLPRPRAPMEARRPRRHQSRSERIGQRPWSAVSRCGHRRRAGGRAPGPPRGSSFRGQSRKAEAARGTRNRSATQPGNPPQETMCQRRSRHGPLPQSLTDAPVGEERVSYGGVPSSHRLSCPPGSALQGNLDALHAQVLAHLEARVVEESWKKNSDGRAKAPSAQVGLPTRPTGWTGNARNSSPLA